MKTRTGDIFELLNAGEYDTFIHFAHCYGVEPYIRDHLPELAEYDNERTGIGDLGKLGNVAYVTLTRDDGTMYFAACAYVRQAWAGPMSGIHQPSFELALMHVKRLFGGTRIVFRAPPRVELKHRSLAAINEILADEDVTLIEQE